MLVLAELIVCSTRGFASILAKWFWPTVMSLSLTYGSPKASCNKRADTYLGRRSASLMNTKCYVMNNEEKLFQQKQSLETLFLLMKKTRAKKFKVRMFYHLQNLFWGFLSGGFWLGGFLSGVFMSGGLCPGGFCPVTAAYRSI